jgi:protein SFI1
MQYVYNSDASLVETDPLSADLVSSFRPTRASPESKRLPLAASNVLGDISRSSAISIPELTGLTPKDVDLIDAIIEHAGPSSTTFLSVFKAYNDVLQQRGLDPNEVVFYGKLLKLGTLKGKNWGDKWEMIKRQQGYVDDVESLDIPKPMRDIPKKLPPRTPTRHDVYSEPLPRDSDSLTLHSHLDDTDIAQSDAYIDTEQQAKPLRSHWPISRQEITPTGSLLDSGARSYQPRIPVSQARPSSSTTPRGATTFDSRLPEDTVDTHLTTPSLNRAAARGGQHQPTSYKFPRTRPTSECPPSTSRLAPSTAHQVVAQARQRRGSVVNEDEAWNKIQMVRDEEEADRFREDVLIDRCWDVWKKGLLWIRVSAMRATNYGKILMCL